MLLMQLYGIYNANGGILGELAYVFGRLLGTTHCALCDISHGAIREKESFRICAAGLPIPLSTLHIDEQNSSMAEFTHGKTPCVLLEDEGTYTLAVDAARLESCGGDVQRFERELRSFLDSL